MSNFKVHRRDWEIGGLTRKVKCLIPINGDKRCKVFKVADLPKVKNTCEKSTNCGVFCIMHNSFYYSACATDHQMQMMQFSGVRCKTCHGTVCNLGSENLCSIEYHGKICIIVLTETTKVLSFWATKSFWL